MATLQRPALRRTAATQPIRASFFDDSNDARNSPQAQQLREQITTVYGRTPFRGQSGFGTVRLVDATWRDATGRRITAGRALKRPGAREAPQQLRAVGGSPGILRWLPSWSVRCRRR